MLRHFLWATSLFRRGNFRHLLFFKDFTAAGKKPALIVRVGHLKDRAFALRLTTVVNAVSWKVNLHYGAAWVESSGVSNSREPPMIYPGYLSNPAPGGARLTQT